jgi:hypothetical protein
MGLAFWSLLPGEKKARTPIEILDEQTKKDRQAMLDQIPQRGEQTANNTPNPSLPPTPKSAVSNGAGPIALGAPAAAAPIPMPTTLAPATLKVGDPRTADPTELAFHPSHFADPTRITKSIGIAVIPGSAAAAPVVRPPAIAPINLSADPTPQNPSPSQPTQIPITQLPITTTVPAPIDHYAEALRLERARAFTMSLCTDLQGRIWIGSENTTPGDGTGGVQCYDPSKPPLEAFTQYLSNDSANKLRTQNPALRNSVFGGLGDDNGYAVACDLQGRIWVGHLNHGISVFNGEKWQNYEVVAGLSIPGSLNGPLGERIFKIVVCNADVPSAVFHDQLTGKDSPIYGSVWMCTSAGLAIYFPSTDSWSYLTRADGLPSDQANSLAFAKDGTVYVATQCDGVASASPRDHFYSWSHDYREANVTSDEPAGFTGSRYLPSDLINDIIVSEDGSLYVATTAGVACRNPSAHSWKLLRGADYGTRLPGDDPGSIEKQGLVLSEDFCSCIAEDALGHVYVGHRTSALEIISPHLQGLLGRTVEDHVTSLLATKGSVIGASFGNGLSSIVVAKLPLEARTAILPVLPKGAVVVSAQAIEDWLSRQKHIPDSSGAAFLGDDWSTQGNWVGHYGGAMAALFAMGSPQDHVISRRRTEFPYKVELLADEKDDKPRSWIQNIVARDRRSLYDPQIGTRRTAGIDDHGEAYPRSHEGPGLGLVFSVPNGLYRVSAYFLNDNGHSGENRDRDYAISMQVRRRDDGWQSFARARATNLWGGVYKEFVLKGPADARLAVSKGTSLNVMCAGLFIDQLSGGVPYWDGKPLMWMADVYVGPGPFRMSPSLATSPLVELDREIRSIADLSDKHAAFSRNQKLMAFRLATSDHSALSPIVVEQWKWDLALWSDSDRVHFDNQLSTAWQHMQQRAPILANPAIRPHSPVATATSPVKGSN